MDVSYQLWLSLGWISLTFTQTGHYIFWARYVSKMRALSFTCLFTVGGHNIYLYSLSSLSEIAWSRFKYVSALELRTFCFTYLFTRSYGSLDVFCGKISLIKKVFNRFFFLFIFGHDFLTDLGLDLIYDLINDLF